MAKIISGKFEFEIIITDYVTECIYYEFFFRWENNHIINDAILKRASSYWKSRNISGILANDDKIEFLINSLNQVIFENKIIEWLPLEPDVSIKVEPIENNIDLDILKYEKNTNNFYKMTIFVDTYNFKNQLAYSGAGLSFIIYVTLNDLKKFVTDLENEYKILYEKYIAKY